MYNRPINYNLQWASGGTPLEPSNEKIINGWIGDEKPLVQHMNWILQRIDGAIGYFMQGMPEWGLEVDYKEFALINYNGVVYRAKQNVPSVANIDISNTDYWEKAFFSSIEGDDLAEEVRKIKEEDGYLDKYLRISNPTTTARMVAGSYSANTGLATTSSFNNGYSFNGNNTTGMYLNGNVITFLNGGTTRLTIPAAVPSLTDRTTSVATTDWVQRLLDEKLAATKTYEIPVNGIFITTSSINPVDQLGYGTWVRHAEGRCLVGFSTQAAHPSWTKTINSTTGQYAVVLSKNQMPKHKHGIWLSHEQGGTGDWYGAPWANKDRWVFHTEDQETGGYTDNGGAGNPLEDTGNNEPHENVQPSIVVFIWRRTT